MPKRLSSLALLLLTSCSLSPDFKLPDISLPSAFKEQQSAPAPAAANTNWKVAEKLDAADRGEWWKIFGDTQLNDLEKQAADANQNLKVAAARVEEARATARANVPSILPDFSIGGNAVRSQPANASVAAFGEPASVRLNPYSLYDADGVLSYEADLFGRVRDNYKAFEFDANAQAAGYKSALLALQADVAQNYFNLRTMDAERKLLRDTVSVYEESARIQQKQFDVGQIGEQDNTRAQSELAGARADLLALDRSRASLEHQLAVLLGKLPSEFTFAEAPLDAMPPEIPAGLPSSLLERRPDIAAAQDEMQAANRRVGVARTAFFPSLILTASGGFESTKFSDLFHWSNRAWALGQIADAVTMPIFDSGRNFAQLDAAHAAYDESVATYRQQVLVAFKDVEDGLASQRLLAEQSNQQDAAAAAAARTTELTHKRYTEGEVAYFEVVDAERDSLAAERAAVEVRGQRLVATVTLVRALGGGWDEVEPSDKTQPAASSAPWGFTFFPE